MLVVAGALDVPWARAHSSPHRQLPPYSVPTLNNFHLGILILALVKFFLISTYHMCCTIISFSSITLHKAQKDRCIIVQFL